MSEAGHELRACALAMMSEADALESSASRVTQDVGLGWLAGAVVEAQEQLLAAVADLVALRRQAAQSLAYAAQVVEELATEQGRRWWSPEQFTFASWDDAVALSPRLEAIAQDLASMPEPQILEVVRSAVVPTAIGVFASGSLVLGSLLWWRAGRDVLGPEPTVTLVTTEPSEQAAAAQEALDESRPSSVAEALENCAYVDALGQQDKAVVDIARVTTASGEESWIVTLPSTKDWVVFEGDTPAPNDLDAILAMALLPGLACTYGRGVVEAIRQAGIPAGAPVLLVGFSLGGMLAADLARTGLGDVHVAGVIAAGAPIDTADDPAGVPVLSLVHEGDIVPALDLAPEGDGALRVTVTAEVDDGVQAHSAAAYAATAEAHDVDGTLSEPFSQFLASDPSTQVEHTQYEIVE